MNLPTPRDELRVHYDDTIEVPDEDGFGFDRAVRVELVENADFYLAERLLPVLLALHERDMPHTWLDAENVAIVSKVIAGPEQRFVVPDRMFLEYICESLGLTVTRVENAYRLIVQRPASWSGPQAAPSTAAEAHHLFSQCVVRH